MLYDCSEGLPKTDYNIGRGQGGRECLNGRCVSTFDTYCSIQENFESLLQSATTCNYKGRQLIFIQNARNCYDKVRQIFYYKVCYYKVRQILQSAIILLQSATEQASRLCEICDENFSVANCIKATEHKRCQC